MKSRIDFAHAQEILAAASPSRDFGQPLLMARHRIASPDKVESTPPSTPDPKKRELTPVERELSSLKWYARQPQELPKISPKFQKLIDYYVIARTNANEPSVSQMVQQTVIDFLGIQPTDLLTVGTCFGRYLRPMIAFALEKLIHESGKYKKIDYLKDHPNGKAVSGVLQTVINPVEIGYRHTVNLPTAGTYYLVWGDQKLVVSFDFNGQCCSISSTVSTQNRGLGEAFLRDFNQSCAENNIYKNRTLTMSEGNLIFLKAESIRLKDVYLPGRIKNEVVENTIGVLENREELLKTSFGINRSILLSGEPGCHAKGQLLLMFDGSLKKVEDIVVGDRLMGPDSKPRTVQSLARGRDRMVEVIPTKGDPFVVNENHILTIRNGWKAKDQTPIDISIKNWLEGRYPRHKLFRVGVRFPRQKKPTIDPYFLGFLLGDGSLGHTTIGVSGPDDETKQLVVRQAAALGMNISVSNGDKSKVIRSFVRKSAKGNAKSPLGQAVKALGLIGTNCGTKFIPPQYKFASIRCRLQLLAGLMDSDGSYDKECNVYDYITKSKLLAHDLVFVARSVGLAAYVNQCTKRCTTTGYVGRYYRICVSGDIDKIPVKWESKKARPRLITKNALNVGFRVRKLGVANYYGFALDGDGRYLMDDFMVTHNTGKTKLFKAIASTVPQCTVIWVSSKAFEYTSDVSLLYDAARDLGPTILVIEDMDLIGAERDSSRDNRLLGEFLTQMSGASANKTTITLASTNSLDKIDRALSNRPGRFDRVLEVVPPSAKFRKKMLVAFLTEFGVKVDVSDQTWAEVVDYTEGMTGAHLQEIAKTSLVKLVVAKKEKTLHDEDLLNATMLVVSNFKHSPKTNN